MVYEIDFVRGLAYCGQNGYVIQNEGKNLFIVDKTFKRVELTSKNCKALKNIALPPKKQKLYNSNENLSQEM